jgi:chromosome segregation ATPase
VVLQSEKLANKIALLQQQLGESKDRASAVEAELRRLQGRRDALTEENVALGQKVGTRAAASSSSFMLPCSRCTPRRTLCVSTPCNVCVSMVVCFFDRVWLMRAFTVLSPPLGYSRLSLPVCSTKHATPRLHRQAAELSVAKQTLESAEAQRRDLQSQLSTLNTKLDAVKGQELVALAKLAGCTEERDRLSTQLQTCTANLEHSKAEVAKLQHDIDTAARRAAVLTQQIVVLTDDLQRSKDETR